LVNKKILIVDDDKINRDILHLTLSRFGAEISTAENGKEGLRLFLITKYDLVITDYNMPEMDGMELAFEIKKQSKITPIIMCTGTDVHSLCVYNGKYWCIDYFVPKPFHLLEIQKVVKDALNPVDS